MCRRTALPPRSLPHASPRGSGNPSPSRSGHLVFFKLLVTTTFTQRVIISLPCLHCHHHPHRYPTLSVISVQSLDLLFFFLTFSEHFKCTVVFVCVHQMPFKKKSHIFLNMKYFVKSKSNLFCLHFSFIVYGFGAFISSTNKRINSTFFKFLCVSVPFHLETKRSYGGSRSQSKFLAIT